MLRGLADGCLIKQSYEYLKEGLNFTFVAATTAADCKLDVTGRRVFAGNQVAESTFNVQQSMALAKLTSVFEMNGSVCQRSLHTVGTPAEALCSHA